MVKGNRLKLTGRAVPALWSCLCIRGIFPSDSWSNLAAVDQSILAELDGDDGTDCRLVQPILQLHGLHLAAHMECSEPAPAAGTRRSRRWWEARPRPGPASQHESRSRSRPARRGRREISSSAWRFAITLKRPAILRTYCTWWAKRNPLREPIH